MSNIQSRPTAGQGQKPVINNPGQQARPNYNPQQNPKSANQQTRPTPSNWTQGGGAGKSNAASTGNRGQ